MIDALSSEAMEGVPGRETVKIEEVRRITLPMRADHRGFGLDIVGEGGLCRVTQREGGKMGEARSDMGSSIIYEKPGGCVEAAKQSNHSAYAS